jgi:phage terminase large subunit-like protein
MEAARVGLIDFACYVDPDRQQAKWYKAAHLRKIAALLERCERREIKRLIINVPPRHWKSSLASEKFPAWWLGRNATDSVIIASYASSLAEKYSKSVRELISSARYRQLFPDVRIRKDSNRADDWLLESGYRTSFRAVGTGGGIAGYGFDLAVIDDVSDPNKQASRTETENDWNWYKNVIRTRAEPDAVIVIVNNRVGVDDLTGYLLDKERNDSADPPEDWMVVNLPALDETTGTYLWEERFGIEYYQKIQNDPNLWRIQYQQRPTIEEGTLIKREWFGHKLADDSWEYDIAPALPVGATWTVQPIDAAFTEKQTQKHDPDWCATCKMCFYNNIVWLGQPRLWRKGTAETIAEIVSLKMENPKIRLGMGRVAIRSDIIAALNNAGYNIEEYPEIKDKISASSGWRNVAETGRVRLVGTVKEWEQAFEQWFGFPNALHDDAVDMVTIGYRMLNYPLSSMPHNVQPKRRLPRLAAMIRGR